MRHALLLVEDDVSLGETLQERLSKEGYDVTWSETLSGAREVLRSQIFDLVILDVGLPDGTGFELAQEISTEIGPSETPFLFMTAMNTAENRLAGFEMGAEEFIPKPFHLKELLLRVGHVLATHPPRSLGVLDLSDRVLDFRQQAVVLGNGDVQNLPLRDFQVLKLLVSHAPRVVSRDEILNQVWGEDQFPSHRTVDNAIVRLRQSLGEKGGKMIRSVRGVGYQWVKDNE